MVSWRKSRGKTHVMALDSEATAELDQPLILNRSVILNGRPDANGSRRPVDNADICECGGSALCCALACSLRSACAMRTEAVATRVDPTDTLLTVDEVAQRLKVN